MARLPLLGVLLLAACETGPTLDQRLSTFIGRTEGDLVAALGVPVRTHEVEGRRFLQFESRRTVLVPTGSPFVGPYGRGVWGWPQDTAVPLICEVTFALREGRAESFSYRGNGC